MLKHLTCRDCHNFQGWFSSKACCTNCSAWCCALVPIVRLTRLYPRTIWLQLSSNVRFLTLKSSWRTRSYWLFCSSKGFESQFPQQPAWCHASWGVQRKTWLVLSQLHDGGYCWRNQTGRSETKRLIDWQTLRFRGGSSQKWHNQSRCGKMTCGRWYLAHLLRDCASSCIIYLKYSNELQCICQICTLPESSRKIVMQNSQGQTSLGHWRTLLNLRYVVRRLSSR